MIGKLNNLISWKSKSPTVVFLVDDYGAVKSSKEVIRSNSFTKAKIKSNNRFNKLDGLSTVEDFSALFEVLTNNISDNGSQPKFTLATCVANPNFEEIARSNTYSYKKFWESIKDFGGQNLVSYWKEGIENNLIAPELHGREHLNPIKFMEMLENDDQFKRIVLDYHCLPGVEVTEGEDYLAAFDFMKKEELNFHKEVLNSSISIFEESFDRVPSLFIAPKLLYHKSLNHVLVNRGIQSVDKARKSIEPKGYGKYGKSFNYLGKSLSKSNLKVITRNVMFEPCSDVRSNWVEIAFKKVKANLDANIPAIISSHRVNFVGGIEEGNRTNGLKQLNELLKKVNKEYPEVHYKTVGELVHDMKR